ncbi:sugar lactone lactonase YvrE [Roseiarcus fermentans]|uniref:Sugar lactone lactonase YvrE n=1 Tax=Roseiarcus fermentans TaxID=1473586 RepID=A0A366FRX5_9HYPH|nr:sugar lactone lactonase YvrE [Roseiarcus fermentans]
MTPVRKALDRWLGRGEASITTPPMDGAFRPNDLLDAAASVLQAPAPDDLAMTGLGLIVSSGRSLLLVNRSGDAPVAVFDVDITALAGLPDGGAAVALVDGRIVFVGGRCDGKTIEAKTEVRCITALATSADGALLVANGSAARGPAEWKRDLMEKGASGSVWRLEPASGAWTQIAGRLAYPNGLLDNGDSIVVSESWRCALTRVSRGAGGRLAPVLEDLPAYPSRLSRDRDGAVWLALFAPRSQLVEFVLSEDRYRRRMIDDIDADYWVAPCLRSGSSPLEPTQQGGVKQLGVTKPWSPSRSYGLVARLDGAFRPQASLHSRTNGRRHGVTSCLASEGRVYFTAKGDGVVGSHAYRGSMS